MHSTEPTLCNFCENQKIWPKCMSNVDLRGYIEEQGEFSDDVVKCDNYAPMGCLCKECA